MLATRSKPPAEPTHETFLAAREAWRKVDAEMQRLNAEATGWKYAIEITGTPGNVPDRIREAAGEERLELARKKPRRALQRLEDARDDRDKFTAKYAAAAEAWAAAKRRETNRIARELQPQHRAAVQAIAKALEELSLAIFAERECRQELARRAPETQSAYLPDCTPPAIGALGDVGSPASAWAKQMRKLGVI